MVAQARDAFPDRNPRRWGRWAMCAPPVVAVILALPCFKLPYEWDDFEFLGRAQTLKVANFLPDPHAIFYRPIARELYFGILWAFGPEGFTLAHALNALLLAVAVALLGMIGNRLGGPKVGFLSATSFAVLGSLPMFVAYVRCIQDLLAIVCILACLHCHLRGKPGQAILWMAASLLSKETSASLIPAMLASEWASGKRAQRIGRVGLGYAALIAIWTFLHPGIHLLASGRIGSEGSGYIGIDNPQRFSSFVNGALTLANMPVIGPVDSWDHAYTFPLIAAALLLISGLGLISHRSSPGRSAAGLPPRRVLVMAALM